MIYSFNSCKRSSHAFVKHFAENLSIYHFHCKERLNLFQIELSIYPESKKYNLRFGWNT